MTADQYGFIASITLVVVFFVWAFWPYAKENFMGKNKKLKQGKTNNSLDPGQRVLDDPYAEQRNTFYQEIHNVETKAEPKKSPLLVLRTIVEPNTRSEDRPNVEFVAVAVRADAIDIIEPATYGSEYVYEQEKPKGGSYASIYDSQMYALMYGRTYWSPTGTKACVRVHTITGPDYLVEETVEGLKDRIDFLEA